MTRILPTTDAEDDLSEFLVNALGDDMAFALDTPGAMLTNGVPLAEFVRHRTIRDKRRRIRVVVTMENATEQLEQ